MRKLKWRVLSLILALAMVLTSVPMTAKAAEPNYILGTESNTTGVAPGDVDGTVWVEGTPETKTICGNLYEHIHGTNCYTKSCDHKNGHLSTCYSTSTEYELCEHENDEEHTGTGTLSDVVEIDVKLSGTTVTWKTEHPAYDAIFEVYDKAYQEAYDYTYANTKYFKETAAKAAGIAAGVAVLTGKTFCYTVSESATPDLCTHTCSELGGSCYTKLCVLTEHNHDNACYETTYTWTLYADANNNGTPDYTETFTVQFMDGNNLIGEPQTLAYDAAITTPDTPTGAEGWVFDSWNPTPSATVNGTAVALADENNVITYNATWKPDVDKNEDNIPDGRQGNTINVTRNTEVVTIDDEKLGETNTKTVALGYNKETGEAYTEHVIVITPEANSYFKDDAVTVSATDADNKAISTDRYTVKITKTQATVTINVGASETYNINVESTAKKETFINVVEDKNIGWDGTKNITAEEVVDFLVVNVTDGEKGIAGKDAVRIVEDAETGAVISKKALWWRDAGDVIGDEGILLGGVPGTYRITVTYPETDEYLASSKTIEFKVVDGHINATLVLENGTVGITDTATLTVDEETMINALNPAAKAGEATISDPGLSVVWISKLDEETDEKTTVYPTLDLTKEPEITEYGQYEITVALASKDNYYGTTATAILTVVDNRVPTTITLNENVSVVYSTELTEEDIYNAVFASLTAEDGSEVLPVFGENMSVEIDNMNAGTYTVTVKFAGNNTQAASSAECELVIEKANTTVSVESKTVKYQDIKDSGVNVSGLISASPEASMIKYAVGLKLGDNASADAGAIAYVSIPSLIDMDSIPSTIRPYVEPIINAALGSLENGATMTVSQLKSVLEGVLKGLESVEGFVPVGIDTTAINALVSALQAIEGMEGVGSLTVKLLVGNDIVVKDSGMYVTGGVVTDANYNTAVNMGYLVITPDGTKVELAFNVEDANGIITRGAILSGEYDLGSHVVEDGISEEVHAGATEHLVNVYIGVDAEGNTVMSDTPSADIGAYTQIAYIRDLGNEMYYAEPIVRSYVVVADTAIVEFIDENGNVNDERVFTFDGTPKSMTARATDRNGNPLPSENISYKYIGIEGDAEGYYGSEAPTEAGVYTVIATYIDAEQTHVGMAIGAMIIQPADSSIEVADKIVTYDGNPVDVLGMITKTPEDAKMAVIMAGLDVSGDFSENGLSAVKGVVNIDFPARVDEILAQYVPSAYADGITIDSFINKIDEINTALAEQGMESEYLNEIKGILAQMPNATTLTFKEQSEVNPTSIGAYLVQAVIFDPNYKPEVDTGILVIAPEVKEVVLDWNYTDVNGIITRPILDEVDLGATAFNSADSTKNDEYTGKVKYLFVGVDTEGNQVMTDDASTLPNGAYTQIAYVPAEDVSASMTLVAPIMRSFVIAPQGANVDFVDVNGNDARLFTYDGTPKAMDVEVTDMAGIAIPQELLDKYLTVTYVGVDVEGGYNSTTPPTEIGAYTVTAVYAEYDENGELVRAGMDVGAMVIEPKENGFGVDDTTVPYDGKEHLEEAIVNANDLEYITIITDEENNVNVILPESWGVETTELKLKEGIAAVIKELDKLPEEVKNESAIKAIYNALNKLDEIKSLTLNGAKPVEVGVYNVVGISYGENYKVAVDAGVLTIAQRELNIVIDDKEKVYGDKDPEFTYTVNGIVAGEDVKVDIELVREEGEDVGEYVITIADEATPAATTEEGKSVISNPNYKLGTVTNGTLTINPIEVVITPDALQKYVGETDPAITFKAEGILKGDDVTITVLRADGETAGVYEYVSYVADGEDAGNYTFTLDTTNKFTILEKDNTGEGDKPGDGTKPEDGNKPNDGEASDDKTSADETSKDKVVESGKTGDNANIGLYLGLALAAMAAIVAVLFSRKRSR